MVIVLGLYAGLIWLLFFKLKLLPWSRGSKALVALVGLVIVLVVIGLLNTRTPSGRVTVVAHVVEIAPVVGGVVTNVPVVPNTLIKAGSVLFEIEKAPYKANLDEAKAELQIAQSTYDRKQAAFDANTISEQSLDETRAALAAARARMDRAQYDFDQTVVTAPSDGIVTSLGVSVGDQARPLSPVMPFLRADSLFLVGVFAQNGLDGMPPGTPVRILLDRKPGQIFDSKVVEIAPGTSSGQIPVGADILGADDIGSTGEALVVLAWPDGLDQDVATAGTIGSATAFGPDAGAMGILATVLLYMKMIGTYL
jgi:RND family efflux transporter MFP subunit